MRDGGRIAAMSERDDRDPALAGIGGMQAIIDVIEIVVGFETDLTWLT